MAADMRVRRGDAGYDALRSGFNIALDHRPELIIDATNPADVIAAVKEAAETARPVGVMNTGHGPSVAADAAVLVRTGRMRRVEVDPVRRTARIEAGAVWRDVIEPAAAHGLAPLNGSSPAVGAVGYALGGGVGLLARRFGFAADHVRSMDVVTADGQLRHVTASADADLFWALRGAGANFGVVTAMEVDLFPVSSLLGGELCFGSEVSQEVLHAYASWAREVPEALASSLLLLSYPEDPAVPPQLRGRHITHLRIAFTGEDLAKGEQCVQRLRRIGPPVLDTVRVMPYADIGTIHHEPTEEPVPAFDRNILLREFDSDAALVLSKHAGPAAEAPFLTELRAWGGALSRPSAVPNAVGGRNAAFSLLAISDRSADNRTRRDDLLTAMSPWAHRQPHSSECPRTAGVTGMTFTNFAGVEDSSLDAVRRAYLPEDFRRLQAIKAVYDPHNMFRINFNIPPQRSAS